MLRKLQIRNFKNWADTGNIKLAPITVFFGGNSSGKSSLLQFLLMLRQTAESPDRRRVLHPGDHSTPVELGTIRDLIYSHDLNKEISFELSWDLPEVLQITDPLHSAKFSGTSLSFEAAVAFHLKDQLPQPYVSYLAYKLLDSDAQLSVSMKPEGQDSGSFRNFSLQSNPYQLKRIQGRAWKLPPPIRFYGFPDEVNAYYQNASFTSDLTLALEQSLRRIQYLGPLRTVPKRAYVWSGEVPDHVGWGGDRAVEALLAASNREISRGKKMKAQPFQALIARWLKQMGLLATFEVRQIAKNRREYEVIVNTLGNTTPVTLPDIGFGVSQVLPVIVQCFYAQPNTTILLEQPEIHLHPSVQMALADLFIETVHSREAGQARGIQLIVESHSEHFLRRLQRRVAEGVIPEDDVALYFCDRGKSGAQLRALELDLWGNIQNWPDDFFGAEMEEITQRMVAAAERQDQSS